MRVKIPKEYHSIRINRSMDIFPMIQKILLRETKLRRVQEHFWVMGMDNANNLLFVELAALGAQNRFQVNPADVYRMAIHKMALKIIICHNHPSGKLIASEGDIYLTDRILKIGEIIGVELLDHIIISETHFLSFNDAGIMNELKNSDAWRPLTSKQELAREMRVKTERRKWNEAFSKTFATKLLERGVSYEIISETTGLSRKTISNLMTKRKQPINTN